MDLAEVKAWRGMSNWNVVFRSTTTDHVDWLIAEVERLTVALSDTQERYTAVAVAEKKIAEKAEAEVSRLTALCAEHKGEVDRLTEQIKAGMQPLANKMSEYAAENARLTALCDGYRGEDRVECIACPECHSEEYVNADLLGRGHRECKQCGQDWWTNINYGKIDVHTKPLEAEIKRLQSALTRARAEGVEEACGIISGILAEVHGYGVTRALTRACDAIRARANGDSDAP